MPVVHHSDFMKAEKEFTDAFGQSLIQWGVIEQRLCFWFHRITAMEEKMARQIFYAVTSFNARSRMLRGAILACGWPEYATAFINCALSKSITYDSFRNHIVHRETKFDFREGSPTQNKMILIEGKAALIGMDLHEDGSEVYTFEDLAIARDNFRELARLIMDGYQCAHDPAQLQECHRLVHALPTRAHSNEPNLKPLVLPPLPEPTPGQS
jgi:hypothetical protein